MFPTFPTYNVGDIIHYTPFGGGVRRVFVTEKHADVKGGHPGFDGSLMGDEEYNIDEGLMVWGYDDQIIKVVGGDY